MLTILLSTYNGSKFLQQQLESLYQQTYPHIRILVRDDGSSDSTRNILDSEQARGRIEILAGHNNLGPAQSFFELLRNAVSSETEYVAFCDQDDIWHPEKITHAVSTLMDIAGHGPAMYCSRLEIVDEQLNHIGYTEMPGKLGFGNALVENVAVGCTVLLNRDAIELIGKNLPSRVYIHDWWCYLVSSCFGQVVYDNNAYIKYRQHGGNTIGVASNRLGHWRRKWRRFFGRGEGHRWLSEQATIFSSIFQERIPLPQRRIVERFVAGRSSLRCRLQMVFSSGIWRQKWSDNLILRILILIDRT